MMILRDLLRLVGIDAKSGTDVAVGALRVDSRKVKAGDVFMAYPGAAFDGRHFIDEALDKGAAAVLTEPGGVASGNRPLIEVPGLSGKVAELFDAWYGFPARDLQCVAVTGTNGKTTTALLSASILQAAGRKPMYFGTIHYDIGGEILPASLTTPGPEEFYALLRKGVDKGCDAVVMEVSSHSLHQNRIAGMAFDRALFTNLTQDHLDYHADMESYFQAKSLLFSRHLRAGGQAVINLDSTYGARLVKEMGLSSVTFTQTPAETADIRLLDSSLSLEGTRFRVAAPGGEAEFSSCLVGRINLENLLGAVSLGFSLGMATETIAEGIRNVTVPGRNEILKLKNGAFAVIDYAHTPDALERVLRSLKPLTPGRLVCLFGCGGDRDRGKRPQMGRIAEDNADITAVTSDNPRTEDPDTIIREILSGMQKPEAAVVVSDRKAAISRCLAMLGAGDCLLIAGKGHEDYQIIGKERRHFSDREQVIGWMAETLSTGVSDGT